MAKDISLFTRYIYFHPLNPLCEWGREEGEDRGCVSKDRWARDQIQRGSNPARMLREMRHSADTLNPNQRMDVV